MREKEFLDALEKCLALRETACDWRHKLWDYEDIIYKWANGEPVYNHDLLHEAVDHIDEARMKNAYWAAEYETAEKNYKDILFRCPFTESDRVEAMSLLSWLYRRGADTSQDGQWNGIKWGPSAERAEKAKIKEKLLAKIRNE